MDFGLKAIWRSLTVLDQPNQAISFTPAQFWLIGWWLIPIISAWRFVVGSITVR